MPFKPPTKVYGYIIAEPSAARTQSRAIIAKYKRHWKKPFVCGWGGIFQDDPSMGIRSFFKRPQAAEMNRLLEPGDIVIFGRLNEAFASPRKLRFTMSVLWRRAIQFDVARMDELLGHLLPVMRWPKPLAISGITKSRSVRQFLSALRRRA